MKTKKKHHKKLPNPKTLQKKISNALRDYVILTRRFGLCELCPNPAQQADHCFSRRYKELMFELSNLTAICKSCHFQKTHAIKGYDLDVYEHVGKREGEKRFKKMYAIAKKGEPFKLWSDRGWLEWKLVWARDLLRCAQNAKATS